MTYYNSNTGELMPEGNSLLLFRKQSKASLASKGIYEFYGPYDGNSGYIPGPIVVDKASGVATRTYNTVQANLANSIEVIEEALLNLKRAVGTTSGTLNELKEQIAEALSDLVDRETSNANPFAVNGYYPLYSTEEFSDKASTNGESHAHELDGITYYMPDEGQTIYHGTYETTDTSSSDSGY